MALQESAGSSVISSDLSVLSPPHGDINVAAALRAQYAIETPRFTRRRQKKGKHGEPEHDEEVVDMTRAIPLHSKKTDRIMRKQRRKEERAAMIPSALNLLDLPGELVLDIFSHLQVVDLFSLLRACRILQDLILQHRRRIATDIIRRRYWILHRCFPLPVPFSEVPLDARPGLLSEKRQEMLNIHRKSYHQHIEMIDPHQVCTCMTCVFAWNNLCLIVDLHHWQKNLRNREPISMIPRGTYPEWNTELIKHNADVVRRATVDPLFYAAILEKHLDTITQTILRFSKWRSRENKAKPRTYHLTDWDVEKQTDQYLDRSGPPSYDFPFHRDNYYSLEVYLPNRKYGTDNQWHYYGLPPVQHEKDLDWVRSTASTTFPREKKTQALANLKDHNIRWSQYLERAKQV